ncbi:MAG: alpha/beta hydrolase [Coleofasciculaceae cyanobacterium]
MFVVTNRNLQTDESPEKRFGETFNDRGPNELRIAEAQKVGGVWQVEVLPDRLIYQGEERWASEVAFLQGQARMREQKKNCLLFVHGFNTDFRSALETGHTLETLYGMEIVMFTWPSNAGGLHRVVDNYRSDKQDASLSINAFDRCLEILNEYILKHRETDCGQKLSLALHSMGAFLFKKLLQSSIYEGETLLFDNVIMLAADVNNQDHSEWMDKIKYRNRLYITINEDDFALAASRAKPGPEQRARLGQLAQNLNSRNAIYLDFTDAPHVGDSHSYFQDDALNNRIVRQIFEDAFNGRRAERGLEYDLRSHAYRIY